MDVINVVLIVLYSTSSIQGKYILIKKRDYNLEQ